MELPNTQDRTYDSKRWLHHASSDMFRVLNALAFLFLYVRGFAPQLKWLMHRRSVSKETWLLTRAGTYFRIHRKPDAAQEFLKARVGANRVPGGVDS